MQVHRQEKAEDLLLEHLGIMITKALQKEEVQVLERMLENRLRLSVSLQDQTDHQGRLQVRQELIDLQELLVLQDQTDQLELQDLTTIGDQV